MPTDTFENLKPEKRDAFVRVSLREFGLHTFREASISRIVAELGIAKGSVYQYFENKLDLYRYLIDVAVEAKFRHIQEAVVAAGDFYELYSAIVLAGADFDFSQPRYSLLIANAMQEHDAEGLSGLPAELERRSSEFLATFVRNGISRGEIRHDLDPLLIVHLVNAATLSLPRYMEEKYDFSLVEQLEHPQRPLPFSGLELREAVQSLMRFVRTGLLPARTET